MGAKTTEIEGLKAKAKQYVDYDDIKRELEIMKVSCIFHFHRFGGLKR